MAVLGAAAPHWREVARGLGFSHQEVEMVLSDIRHQNQLDYLEETVSQWLRWEPKNGHPYPVAEDLVKTLRLEEVGEYGLAEEVEKHSVLMSQDRTKGDWKGGGGGGGSQDRTKDDWGGGRGAVA